jgi:hypothetical protein
VDTNFAQQMAFDGMKHQTRGVKYEFAPFAGIYREKRLHYCNPVCLVLGMYDVSANRRNQIPIVYCIVSCIFSIFYVCGIFSISDISNTLSAGIGGKVGGRVGTGANPA